MDSFLRHKLLAYLAGAAIALSSGSIANAGPDLTVIPEPIMVELLDDVVDEDWRTKDLIKLAEVLTDDPRRQVRCRTADFFARTKDAFSGHDLEPFFRKLAQDQDPMVRSSAARGIGDWLARLDEFERDRVVLEWALSASASVRETLARVLSQGVATLGADLAIEHLASDDNSKVRFAVVQAAERQFQGNPSLYSELLRRLTSDATRSVRRSARRAAVRLHRPT